MKTTTIQLPDGSEVDIQTDDPTAAATAARKIWANRQTDNGAAEQTPQPRTALQTAGDFLGDTIDNLIPNFGDEIAAMPDAAKAAVTGKPVGEAFNRGRREFREHQAQYDKEHPYLAWGSTIAGTGASLALPAGELAQGAGWGARLLHGAAVGAAYGGLAGAGEGDSLGDRANNAATGSLAGSVLGGTMAPLAQGASRLGRYARQALPGVDRLGRGLANVPRSVMRKARRTPEMDRHDQALRFLRTRMNQGHVATGFGEQGAAATPDSLMAEVERRRAMNVPAILGDVSDAMRTTTSWASRGMGPGQTMVRHALDARKAQEAARVRDHVVQTFGPVADPLQQAEAIRVRAKAQAAPGYRAAYSSPMVITPEIRAIMGTPAFREAVPHAVRNIQNGMRSPTDLGFELDHAGNLTGFHGLSTEGFDQVIRAMRDNAANDMRPADFIGGRPTNTTNTIHISQRAKDLKAALAAQNPAYRDVTERYADDMAQREAMLAGKDFGNLTGNELRQVRLNTPQTAHEAWSVGARSAMGSAASDFGAKHPTGDTASRVRQMLGDDVKQREVSELTGNTGAVRNLQDRLEAEHQGNILWKEVQGNSKTAQRQQADRDLDQALGSFEIPNMSPTGILTKAANLMQSGVSQKMRNEVKDHVARIVTEQHPDRLKAFLDEVANVAERDEHFANRLHRVGLIGTKAGAMNVEAPDQGQFGTDGDFYMTNDGYVSNLDDTIQVKLGGEP